MPSVVIAWGQQPIVAVWAAAVAVVIAALLFWRRVGRSAASRERPFRDLNQRQFESLARESFRQQGYALIATQGAASESGELVLRRDRETMLVQCRHWRDSKVGPDAVRALQHSLAQRAAGSGFLLTTGRFSRAAIAAAAGANIRLLDGPALEDLLGKVAGKASSGQHPYK